MTTVTTEKNKGKKKYNKGEKCPNSSSFFSFKKLDNNNNNKSGVFCHLYCFTFR